MQLTDAEQRFILSSPIALAELMTYHDMNHSHAASVLEADDVPPWPPARWLELKNIGHAIVSQDEELWSADILKQFDVAGHTKPVPIAQVTEVSTPAPGTVGQVVATIELTPEYITHLQDNLVSRAIKAMRAGEPEAVAAPADQIASLLYVEAEAAKLIELAKAHGMTVTIQMVPRNYQMEAYVKVAR